MTQLIWSPLPIPVHHHESASDESYRNHRGSRKTGSNKRGYEHLTHVKHSAYESLCTHDLTMVFSVSGAPLTVAMWCGSAVPSGMYPATTDIRFNAEEKWLRWKIRRGNCFPLFGMTVSSKRMKSVMHPITKLYSYCSMYSIVFTSMYVSRVGLEERHTFCQSPIDCNETGFLQRISHKFIFQLDQRVATGQHLNAFEGNFRHQLHFVSIWPENQNTLENYDGHTRPTTS